MYPTDSRRTRGGTGPASSCVPGSSQVLCRNKAESVEPRLAKPATGTAPFLDQENSMRQRLLALALASCLLAAPAGTADTAKDERKAFHGAWKTVRLVNEGKEVAKKVFQDWRSESSADGKYVLRNDRKVLERGTFVVDAGKTPHTIDFHITEGADRGKTSLGIYKFEKGRLICCYGVAGSKKRPTTFEPQPGTGFSLQVFERVKP